MITIQEGKTLGLLEGKIQEFSLKNKNKNPQLFNSYNQKRPKRNFNKVQCEDLVSLLLKQTSLKKLGRNEENGKLDNIKKLLILLSVTIILWLCGFLKSVSFRENICKSDAMVSGICIKISEQ